LHELGQFRVGCVGAPLLTTVLLAEMGLLAAIARLVEA